jgi:hypothetical protein
MKMKKLSTLLIILGLTFGAAIPASAATCGDLLGFARVDASGAGDAQGTAVTFFDGGVEVVEIDSVITGSSVEQTWHFNSGDVQVTETPNPVYLNGPLQLIDSDVVVHSPNSGDWIYEGVFNGQNLRASFVVKGELCIGS